MALEAVENISKDTLLVILKQCFLHQFPMSKDNLKNMVDLLLLRSNWWSNLGNSQALLASLIGQSQDNQKKSSIKFNTSTKPMRLSSANSNSTKQSMSTDTSPKSTLF